MTINLSVPRPTELKPRIAVVGVGGAGGNAVNNMISADLEGVEFVVANTDAQALAQSLTERRIQLGVNITHGLGAGSNPAVGRRAAEESMAELMDALNGCHMVFITAGMGGGTGTGAAPVIAQAARDAGILTIGVVTKPFQFEGSHRMGLAETGIAELTKFVDTLIVIPNQNLFRVANEKTTFADAFKMADDVLYSGVRGVTDLMVMPGLINLDFADVRTVMMEMGKAMMGTGEAEGDKRALEAAEAAISNPLLDDVSMKGARGVLINITGGPDLTLYEVDEAANRIRDEVDPEANIIFGSIFDNAMAGRVRVSVVATGIDAKEMANPRPTAVTEPMVLPRAARPIEAPRAPRPVVVAEAPRPAPEPVAAPELPIAAPLPAATIAAAPSEAPTPVVRFAVDPPAKIEAPVVAAEAPPPAAVSVAPVAAQPLPAAPAAVATAPMTRPLFRAQTRAAEQPFVPQRAVETKPALKAPEPFAEAALANAGPVEPLKRRNRGPSLFERMTGAGRRKPEAAVAPAPAANRAEPRLTATPEVAPIKAEAEAKRGETQAARPEEDLLEIPAFLRRQAN
jgi:cell division protein FtsZ